VQPAGTVPHRGIHAPEGGLRQPLLGQCLQENRGHSDTPRVGPILLGERLVNSWRGGAELLLCLPV
jgi:hypothetical protein